ncbi:hypothetical protein ANO14919_024310 [Xylariales sp. No.14919]|nr:hypothetical protein ANO14919_024310 [Xylariales sp. No.14919]
MVKPNDAIALVIGLHILIVIFISYALVRLFRAIPNLAYADDYYDSSKSSSESSNSPPPPIRPGPVDPLAIGGQVNVGHGVGGQVNVGRGVGGQVNVQRGVGGQVNVGRGVGGQVNIDNN